MWICLLNNEITAAAAHGKQARELFILDPEAHSDQNVMEPIHSMLGSFAVRHVTAMLHYARALLFLLRLNQCEAILQVFPVSAVTQPRCNNTSLTLVAQDPW